MSIDARYGLFPEERNEVRRRSDALRRPNLIPNPIRNDSEHARFHHRDLRGMAGADMFAEQTLLTNELASRIFYGVAERIIWSGSAGQQVTDREWMTQRLTRLEAESQRRKRSTRAA
jgi:hypothetical protein